MQARTMFVAVAAMLLAVGTAQASWSLQNDFSITSNPNGEWSYGHSENGFTLYTTHNSSTWSTSSNEACIWKNLGSSTYLGVLPGEVALHPALHGEQSIARWTSPLDGSITVTGTFGAGDTGKVDTLIYLTRGVGAPQLLFSVYDTLNSQPFNLTPLVGDGDRLDFIVGYGTDSYGSDNTPLSATITPEPATLSLLALGGLAVLVRRKRK